MARTGGHRVFGRLRCVSVCVAVSAVWVSSPTQARSAEKATPETVRLTPLGASEVIGDDGTVIVLLAPIGPGGVELSPAEVAKTPTPAAGSLPALLDGGDGQRAAVKIEWDMLIGSWSEPRSGMSPWLPPSPRWRRAAEAEPGQVAAALRSGLGAWVGVLRDAPPDSRALVIGERRLSLASLPEPAEWAPEPNPAREPERAAADAVVHHLAQGPDRWRAWLLAARVGVALPADGSDAASLHKRLLTRWRFGVARLWRADAHAAARVIDRLSALVLMETGEFVPAWPEDQALLAPLQRDLMDESLRPAALASRARAWLASLPPAAAWVTQSGPEPGVVHVALADLSGEPAAVSVQVGARVEMAALAPHTETRLTVRSSREDADAPLETGPTALVGVGRWSVALPVPIDPLPAAPPGLRLGPLLRERTLLTWHAGTEPEADGAGATSALLQRRVGGEGWELVIACRAHEEAGVAGDSVRVFLGPADAPWAVLRVDARGFVVDEAGPARAAPIALVREPGRWTAVLPLPARAARERLLPIALERTDASGARSTWPLAVFPWQAAPPRAMADLSAWSGLESFEPRE